MPFNPSIPFLKAAVVIFAVAALVSQLNANPPTRSQSSFKKGSQSQGSQSQGSQSQGSQSQGSQSQGSQSQKTKTPGAHSVPSEAIQTAAHPSPSQTSKTPGAHSTQSVQHHKKAKKPVDNRVTVTQPIVAPVSTNSISP